MSGVVGHGNQKSGIVGAVNRLCFYANFDDNGWGGIVYNGSAQLGTGDSQWTERDYGGLNADHYGLFDAAGGVFTAKRKGWYNFDRSVRFAADNADDYFTSYFRLNDTSNFGGVDSDSRGDTKDGGATALFAGGSSIVAMEPGDYIWLVCHHWFSSASHYEVPSGSTFWSGHFIGGV